MQGLIIVLVVILLVIVGIGLIVFFFLNRQVEYYKKVANSVSSMQIIQHMFVIMGENIEAEEKIKKLNSHIIEVFNPKYSTISLFDGTNYEIKATNIENEYITSITNMSDEQDFRENSYKNVSKYLSTSYDKTLTYKSAVERQIRSAMFSPIYYNNTFLGFWLLEDTKENAFDDISKDELAKLKNNLGVFLKDVEFQNSIERAENTDKQTEYFNNIYLYSNVKKIISSYESSAFTLICLKNIPEINEKYGRNVSNMLIVKIANSIKEIATTDTILIRYSGIRLLVISPDANAEIIHSLVERIFNRIKTEVEYVNDEKIYVEPQAVVHTVKKQNLIDKEIEKMVKYIDDMTETNTVKII